MIMAMVLNGFQNNNTNLNWRWNIPPPVFIKNEKYNFININSYYFKSRVKY